MTSHVRTFRWSYEALVYCIVEFLPPRNYMIESCDKTCEPMHFDGFSRTCDPRHPLTRTNLESKMGKTQNQLPPSTGASFVW